MRKISGRFGAVARVTALMGMMLAAVIAAPAQNFITLVTFNGTNGSYPTPPSLAQGTDGSLYGTTLGGGGSTACPGGCGTVFKIRLNGELTTLLSFDGTAGGAYPYAGLVLATDGNFYGVTSAGGASGYGTVFRVSHRGTLTTLYSFCAQANCTDGAYPFASLELGADGNLYGVTQYGGAFDTCSRVGYAGCGTIFRITPAGAFATLHSFSGYPTDGAHPYGALVQASDGNLYGTTAAGGTSNYCSQVDVGCGTVFRITFAGALTTLYTFCVQNCSDGAVPAAGLIQAADGSFLGTTEYSGTNFYGTAFRITSQGELTTLHSFNGPPDDGAYPTAPLVQASDGNVYGTTEEGGTSGSCYTYGCGTVYEITATGTLSILHNFNSADGSEPLGGLSQATDGNVYGTTAYGGALNSCGGEGCGTVYGLSARLPFVKTVPAIGKVGRNVVILGTNLTGATGVTFNGTAATFTVESPTAIKTTVPSGATTGPIQVTLPNGTLTSNVNFRVEP